MQMSNVVSCPLCRITAGECHVDVDNPCSICVKWTSKQWNSLGGPQLEAWIMSRPALSASSSGPASEISSLVSGDVFSDRLLVSRSSPLAQQDLVIQTQNGVNMVSGTATTAPSTATTAPSTAPLPLTAGPSIIEPIVAPLGAQDTPSVIQKARPVISTEQTMQSTAVYGPLPYCRIRHPLPYCRIWHPCCTAVYGTPAIYGTPAVCCHACYVSKAFLPNGLLWSGQSLPSYA